MPSQTLNLLVVDDEPGMRLGVERDVAFAITANPATLIQMARTADERIALIRSLRAALVQRAEGRSNP